MKGGKLRPKRKATKQVVIPPSPYSRQQILEAIWRFQLAVKGTGISRADGKEWELFPSQAKQITEAMKHLWEVAKEA